MNVSNTAYYKPLTTITPSIQREGFDPSTEIEDPWYAPIEKVTPRKYHKYAQASLKEKLYGAEEEEDEPGEDDGPQEEEPKEEPKEDPIPPQPEPQPEEPVI